MKEKASFLIEAAGNWLEVNKAKLATAKSASEVQAIVKAISKLEYRSLFFANWAAADAWSQLGVTSEGQKEARLLIIDFDPVGNWRWFLTEGGLLFKDQRTPAGSKATLAQSTDWLNLKDKLVLAFERELYLAKAREGLRNLT